MFILDVLFDYGLWYDLELVFGGKIGNSLKAVATKGATSE